MMQWNVQCLTKEAAWTSTALVLRRTGIRLDN